jgi:outer membrane protein TolC
LEGFRKRWEQAQAKEKERMADPLENLSAELDVLTEEDAINRLEREQLRTKLELFRLIGRPMGGLEVTLGGQLGDVTMNEEQAVAVALKKSVPVALAAEQVWEQERVTRQMVWEYLPDLTVQSGVIADRRRVGITLSNARKTWGVDVSSRFDLRGERKLSEELFPNGRDWFLTAQLTLPLFSGLARERLRRLRVVLQNERDLVEVQVRQVYHAMLEARQARALQERRVAIARRRFEIYERFRELGRVDDDQVEIFRNLFFQTQEGFFRQQDAYITAQENLRQAMGYFEE